MIHICTNATSTAYEISLIKENTKNVRVLSCRSFVDSRGKEPFKGHAAYTDNTSLHKDPAETAAEEAVNKYKRALYPNMNDASSPVSQTIGDNLLITCKTLAKRSSS